MLVLRRKQGEKLIIERDHHDDIIIHVRYIQPNGKTVQIGIDAPDDCHITRPELDKRG